MEFKKIFYLTSSFLIVASIFLFLKISLVSASSLSLSIYPPIIQIKAISGTKISTPIVIKNLADETLKLQIILKPFTASEENGEIKYFSDSKGSPLGSLLNQNVQIL